VRRSVNISVVRQGNTVTFAVRESGRTLAARQIRLDAPSPNLSIDIVSNDDGSTGCIVTDAQGGTAPPNETR